MKDSIILVDVDGVLLSWEYAFDCWMKEQSYFMTNNGEFEYSISKRYNISDDQAIKLVRIFNKSTTIGYLSPLRDSVKYVKKLHQEHGYTFHVITSLGLDPNAQKLRKINLEKLFGDTVFERIICLDTGADKDVELEKYRNSDLFFIEDNIKNAETAAKMGINSILLKHPHNMKYNGKIPLLNGWNEIYNFIIRQQISNFG